jgi:hypothetical protein
MALAGRRPTHAALQLCGEPRILREFLDHLRKKLTVRCRASIGSCPANSSQVAVGAEFGKNGICGRLSEKKLANRLWSVPFSCQGDLGQ